ncbi:MAG: hypothetical protein QXX83_07295 [Thermofilum sp.]
MPGEGVLLDSIPGSVVATVVKLSLPENSKRLPIHRVHRWWSRRFAAVYRMVLASYLFEGEDEVVRAVVEPSVMRGRARGRVFFEPMMGGGTGVVEAALAGWDAYGVDVNPVAVLAARAGLKIVTEGLPDGFKGRALRVLDSAFESVKELWSYDGGVVTHIFVSRGGAPTWLSVNQGRPVFLCPGCYAVYESRVCPECGQRCEASMRPVVRLPSGLPEEAPGWRVFAVEVRKGGERRYLSAVRDQRLRDWLSATAAVARERAAAAAKVIGEVLFAWERDRLRRAGITHAHMLFTARQLASFQAFAEAARGAGEGDSLLLAAAASEAAKSCCLLAKWYPKLGEVTPAGGVKAHWVPEYTAVVNPLAHDGLRPLARGVIASALRAQLRAARFVERSGGVSRVSYRVAVDDACVAEYPERIDLAVLDPPYGRVRSYASLSAPHFYVARLYEAAAGLALTGGVSLREVEAREAVPRTGALYRVVKRVVERVAERLVEGGRMVLMYNTADLEEWVRVLYPFKAAGLYPRAVYWVLGEPASGVTASAFRGIHLVVFAKGFSSGVHVVAGEPLLQAGRLTRVDVEWERAATVKLTQALNRVFG